MPSTKQKNTKKQDEQALRPRWSIGLFRNDKGRLVTVYVNADGEPVPYEQKRVGDRQILHHGVYAGMPYREARQALLADAEDAGLTHEKPASATDTLPDDFPGAKQLGAAGIVTFADLKAVEDFTSISGVGKKTAEAITEALAAK